MKSNQLLLWAGTLLLALLTACASAPEVRFHSLLPPDAPGAATTPPKAGVSLRLVIGPVVVPAAVDQPQWLVRRPDDTLQALEQDRWASPLRDELRAAIRAGLAARWGTIDGTLPDAASAGAGQPSVPTWRLNLEVLRFDARSVNGSVIEARWSLLPPSSNASAVSCRSLISESADGAGTVPLAAAHRRAVSRLTDDIGRQLQAMASGAAAPCPAPS
jgi:uncharacterized lipoprotein YmbA